MYKTIKSKIEISELFNSGISIHTRDLIVLYKDLEAGDIDGKVVFIAGKKLGKAPTRNYLKRRLRHLYSLNEEKFRGRRVLLIAKKSLASANFWKVNKDLGKLKL